MELPFQLKYTAVFWCISAIGGSSSLDSWNVKLCLYIVFICVLGQIQTSCYIGCLFSVLVAPPCVIERYLASSNTCCTHLSLYTITTTTHTLTPTNVFYTHTLTNTSHIKHHIRIYIAYIYIYYTYNIKLVILFLVYMHRNVCMGLVLCVGCWVVEVVKQVKDLSYVILQTKEKKVSSKYKREIDFCVLVSSKFDHQDEFTSYYLFIFFWVICVTLPFRFFLFGCCWFWNGNTFLIPY